MIRFAAMLWLVMLAACGPHDSKETQEVASVQFTLPEAVSNNAVALAIGPDGPTLYSFNGLAKGKGHADVGKSVFACALEAQACETLEDVPVPNGRLASAAVTVGGAIYLFGGYSVAADGSEVSEPEVHRFDPAAGAWQRMADMPVAVDDSIALVWRERYIYLVSGWSKNANVSLTQVFDTQSGEWTQATAYPGTPVFGHAGGLVGDSMIIADGVKVLPERLPNGSRFAASDEAWRGDIDPDDPTKITWRQVPAHPGQPLYRMASMGDSAHGDVVFAGGSTNPYNIDGIGYDGVASAASKAFFAYDLASDSWRDLGHLPANSMDHRALAKWQDSYYIVGGMGDGQRVTNRVLRFARQ